MSASSLWPPNGCAWCGELERAHGDVHDYSPPADALRLARMKARREARLNPPTRPAVPPETVVTLTANAHDFIDALRYVGDHVRLFDEAAEALADRMRRAAAERMREGPAPAIEMSGTGTERAYRTRRCWCSLIPVVETLHEPDADDLAQHFSRLRSAADLHEEVGGATADPELEAAKHWPAQGSTCAHVCGPDSGHVCDARAATTLRHRLPSGGMRDLPLCGPCAAAESVDESSAALTSAVEQPAATEWIETPIPRPPVDRLFVVAATRVQFDEWCHELGISPRDRRVVHVTGHRQLEGARHGLRYLVLDWPTGPGFAAVAIRDLLQARDAARISDEEFAPWRAALGFTSAMHRLTTDPGATRQELDQVTAGIVGFADRPDAESDATY